MLGGATAIIAPVAHSAAAVELALGWFGRTLSALAAALPALLFGIGGFGLPARARYWLIVFGLLASLGPVHAGLVAYAIETTRETATALLVVSATFAWPGVANLASMLIHERLLGEPKGKT